MQFVPTLPVPSKPHNFPFRPQVYHMCQKNREMDSFLCPNGTLFHQEYLVCDLWFNVDCGRAEAFYKINEVIYSGPRRKPVSSSYQ